MSQFLKRTGRRANRFLRDRFDPQRATEQAGITYITKVGLLSDRIAAITEMNFDETIATEVDSFINWSAQTWEGAIPYLQAKDDQFLLQKVIAYLDNHSVFLQIKNRLVDREEERIITLETIGDYPKIFDINEDIGTAIKSTLEGYQTPIEIEDPESLEDDEVEALEDEVTDGYYRRKSIRLNALITQLPKGVQSKLSTYHITKLKRRLHKLRIDMLQDSKLIIALSFGKDDVESAQTLVISKPEITPRISAPPQFKTSQDLSEVVAMMQQIDMFKGAES